MRKNLGIASIVTFAGLGIGPLGFVVDFLPRGMQETVTNAMTLVFFCSPLLFLVALAIPVVTSPKGPTTHGPVQALVPRWLLAVATLVTIPALGAPRLFSDPLLRNTEVTDFGRFPFTAVAWTMYACFLAGLILTVGIVADCRGRAELDPADEPRTRRIIATRAVTALMPLAAMCCALAAFAVGAAGSYYRDRADRGIPPPQRWAFAADPAAAGGAIAVLITAAVLAIAAAIMFASPPVGDRSPNLPDVHDAAGSPRNGPATPPVR
ncbi:hypothetical protein TTY48_23290 [Tsukamurella sp. TY48]|nr:hypothetical protein TTY48_23290 [Tsukamurella sp. TY48]